MSRVGFIPSLCYNVALEKLGQRAWYHEVCPNVILGAIPLWSTVDELVQKMGVKAVVSMNEPYELKFITPTPAQWSERGVEQLNLPVVDFIGTPSRQQIQQGVQFIHDHVSKERTVYIHCKAGRSRSATMLACYLLRHWQLTPQQATSFLIEKRSHVVFGDTNLKTIQQYYDYLKTNKLIPEIPITSQPTSQQNNNNKESESSSTNSTKL